MNSSQAIAASAAVNDARSSPRITTNLFGDGYLIDQSVGPQFRGNALLPFDFGRLRSQALVVEIEGYEIEGFEVRGVQAELLDEFFTEGDKYFHATSHTVRVEVRAVLRGRSRAALITTVMTAERVKQ